MKKLLLNFLGFIFCLNLQAQIISTVAGGGTGNGLKATNAAIQVYSSSVDSSGNIFFLDNFRLRKVNASDSILSTIAGSGIQGNSGDGGQASLALLNAANRMTMDKFGNIYFTTGQKIRKIEKSSGIISTFAGTGQSGFSGDGGLAINARLYSPYGIATDTIGNIYFTDVTNHRVRKIDASTGIITTVAGNGNSGYSGDSSLAVNAELGFITGICVDAYGNIYIADRFNNCVRKVLANSGIILTIAGNGNSNYSGDGSLAIYSELSGPNALTIDNVGNLYISDANNFRVRKITSSTGIITTYAGTGNPGFSGIGASALSADLQYIYDLNLDSKGNLYVSFQYSVLKVDATTGLINVMAGTNRAMFGGDGTLATNAMLGSIGSTAIDPSGNLFICDIDNNRIRKVNFSNDIINTVLGSSNSGFSGDGGLASLAEINYPSDIVFDKSGNWYFTDQGNQSIRKVDATTGIINTIAGRGVGSFSFNFPTSLAIDTVRNIYFTDPDFHRVLKLNASTGVIVKIAGSGSIIPGFSGDGGLAVNAELNNPQGISVDEIGNIYISDNGNNRVRKIDALTGIITTIAGNGLRGYSADNILATSAKIDLYNVMLDNFGNIYIAESKRIRKVNASTGIITTIVGNGNYGFTGDGGLATNAEISYATGMSYDGNGNLFFADQNNFRIRKVSNIINQISNNANLYNLTISSGVISPSFSSSKTNYSVNTIASNISFIPTLEVASSTIQYNINGGAYFSHLNGTSTPSFTLNAGIADTINFKITAQDGTTIKIYTILVKKVIQLNLQVFLQGPYIGNNKMFATLHAANSYFTDNITDSITVELHQNVSPFNLTYSSTAYLSTSGNSSIFFPLSALGNSYYIVVKHRNSITTWSANAVSFTSNTNYSFKTSDSLAFGSNLANLSSGVFGIFAGDITQDGSVDFNDYPSLDIVSSNGTLGYDINDLNGDASVDFNDYPILDINSSLGVLSITP